MIPPNKGNDFSTNIFPIQSNIADFLFIRHFYTKDFDNLILLITFVVHVFFTLNIITNYLI